MCLHASANPHQAHRGVVAIGTSPKSSPSHNRRLIRGVLSLMIWGSAATTTQMTRLITRPGVEPMSQSRWQGSRCSRPLLAHLHFQNCSRGSRLPPSARWRRHERSSGYRPRVGKSSSGCKRWCISSERLEIYICRVESTNPSQFPIVGFSNTEAAISVLACRCWHQMILQQLVRRDWAAPAALIPDTGHRRFSLPTRAYFFYTDAGCTKKYPQQVLVLLS